MKNIFFSLSTRRIELGPSVIIHDVCTGALCDGNTPDKMKCGCIVAPPGRENALRFLLMCAEFQDEKS